MTRPARSAQATWSALALVFVGGAMGTAARYAVEAAAPHHSPGWPIATFTVNIVGAFCLGLVLEALSRGGDAGAPTRQRLRLLAGTGFCGAFTTYSTFAWETVTLVRDAALLTAMAYAVVAVVTGALAAFAGMVVGARGRAGATS